MRTGLQAEERHTGHLRLRQRQPRHEGPAAEARRVAAPGQRLAIPRGSFLPGGASQQGKRHNRAGMAFARYARSVGGTTLKAPQRLSPRF